MSRDSSTARIRLLGSGLGLGSLLTFINSTVSSVAELLSGDGEASKSHA